MATKDVKDFNGWFNRSYARMKERLFIYGKTDEDAFHDAYLAVRKQVMFSGGIEDWESYFFGCYRRNTPIRGEGRPPLLLSRGRVFRETG